MQTYYHKSLEDLCAGTLAQARQLAEEFPCNDLCADVLEASSIRRTLEALSRNGGISAPDDTDIRSLTCILDRELDGETLAWQRVLDGWVDPDVGQIGTIKDVRVLTVRGKVLEGLARRMQEFVYLRSVCRARRDAERLLLRS